ncbi:MAG TPA: alcohol dehydrogenase [Candidatus Caldiarchaeum subterraneum]|uniref:Alcohol dehydrogenase n=1 Tax=Caldiarchaeum subterraneum TaxID=311458 RepID=A0A832ZXH2_CALS0|nr:alcohol dehydrogenase [Candidatus Caldarchaeum subterraneum]
MKAAILNEVNKPLSIEEINDPSPRDFEVLVKVASCGVCHTDLHVMKGEVKFPLPCVLGHEISGTVDEVGKGVEGLTVGDRVVCPFIMPCGSCKYCSLGRDDLCEKFFNYNRLQGKLYDGDTRLFRKDGSRIWMYSMGGLAEYAVVPYLGVFKLPDNLPLNESAILGCAAFTAYGAVKNQADLRAGESVAVIAVGGVGLNIIQWAKTLGAVEIIAVDVKDEKLTSASKLGATHVVNSSKEDAVKAVMDITDGEGVDIAFEALGRPETIIQAFNVVKDGGKVVVVGIAPVGTSVNIDIMRMVRRGIRIIGSYGARTRIDMPTMLKLVSKGALNLQETITRKYRLEEVNEGYTALSKGEIVGRAIIQP